MNFIEIITGKRYKRNKYIKEKMKEFSANILDFKNGDDLIDTKGYECCISEILINSIGVIITPKTGSGSSSLQYFSMNDFNKRFKKKL